MDEVVAVAIRAVHILSIIMLIGSAFYIRFVEQGMERIPAWYVLLPVIGVLGSGGCSSGRRSSAAESTKAGT